MIDAALKKINKDIKRDNNSWEFTLKDRQVLVITDPVAERMRILVPIASAADLDQPLLLRMMQANFDSALDARYAIAHGVLWGTYIHPLVSLDETGFVSGLAQALAVAQNFGGNFSSGVMIFGGGDSQKLQLQDLRNQLKEEEDAQRRNTT